jgi:hypothetical protein
VREAVRIQQRGSVLIKRWEFKLTQMDVDVMRERKYWDQAWFKQKP